MYFISWVMDMELDWKNFWRLTEGDDLQMDWRIIAKHLYDKAVSAHVLYPHTENGD